MASAVCYDESWACALSSVDPYFYAYLGVALSLGLSVLGAAWGKTYTTLFFFDVSWKDAENYVEVWNCEKWFILIPYSLLVLAEEEVSLDLPALFSHHHRYLHHG